MEKNTSTQKIKKYFSFNCKLPEIQNQKIRDNSVSKEVTTKNSTQMINCPNIKITNIIPKGNMNESKTKSNTLNKATYYYLIYPGNNSSLIKKCLETRKNWVKSSELKPKINFIWKKNTLDISFENLSKKKIIFNHLENQYCIANKMNLYINIINYTEKKKLDPFKYIPLTIIMHYDSPCYVNQIEKFEYIFNNIKEFLYPNNNPNIKLKKYGKYFPLAKQVEPFGMKTKFYIHKNHYQDKNLWIAKASDLNRGRCIRMIDSIQMLQDTNKKFYEGIFKGFMRCENELKSQKDLKSSIEKNTKGKKEKSLERSNFRRYRTSSVLIQKYIENPLLYNGRKFDIRMWVMLSVSKDVYIFK